MPKNIPWAELKEIGILVSAQKMDNGELRVRCMQESGSGYIWTEPPAGEKPSWQNAHYHKGIRETYVVEKGKMAFASRLPDGDMVVQVYEAGTVITSQPDVLHNVYLFSGAAIHTVKHGQPIGNPENSGVDWYAADPMFDSWTKSLSEDQIQELSG